MENEIKPEPRLFERVTCGRCGGSGHYSYCQSYGTTCFGCAGSGKKLTKRGAAAAQFMTDLLSKPGSELKVGDKIKECSVTNGGTLFTAWFTIVSIEPLTAENAHCYQLGPNNEKIIPANHLKIELNNPKLGGLSTSSEASKMYRFAHNAAFKTEALNKALDYQDTLTRLGTVRKIRGAK